MKNFFDILPYWFDVRIHKTHPMKMNKLFRKDLGTYIVSGVHVSGSSLKASRSSLLQGMY